MPPRAVPYTKAVVHLVLLVPFLGLLWTYRSGYLAQQADPVSFLTHATGNWALWILIADLAITPVRRIHPSLSWLVRLRRMIGLYAFFYATLHLLTYVLLYSGYDTQTALTGLRAGHLAEPWLQLKLIWPSMVDDVLKRPFIQFGLGAWITLLLLALSSPQRVLRWMGGKRWQALHRMIYVAAIAGVIHYWWLVKAGVRTPWKDTALLIVLLGVRIAFAILKRSRNVSPPRTAEAAF